MTYPHDDGSNVLDLDAEDESVAPIGEYDCDVVSIEIQKTKAGDGHLWVVDTAIVSGPHSGISFRDWINVYNPNPTAQRLGRVRVKQLCKAVGLKGQLSLDNPPEIKTCPLTVSVEVDEYNGEKVNKVAAYLPPNARTTSPRTAGDFGKSQDVAFGNDGESPNPAAGQMAVDFSDDDIPY